MTNKNIPNLTIARLKAYRKSLLDRINNYNRCWCGCDECNHKEELAKSNIIFQELCENRDLVNKTLAEKQLKKPKKTVKFNFEQKGFNAHTAEGEFTYDTEAEARESVERLKTAKGFSNIRLL
jgi:hypothetical protein